MRGEEAAMQVAFMRWVRLQQNAVPALRTIHHIPNGEKRSKVTAARLKAMGVLAGVPDIFWPCARHGFHGLYIEFKASKGRLSEAQENFIDDVARSGYAVAVIEGDWEAAKDLCLSWLAEDGPARLATLQ